MGCNEDEKWREIGEWKGKRSEDERKRLDGRIQREGRGEL